MANKKRTKTQRINALLASNPELTVKEVAKRLGVTPNLVHQVKWQAKKNSEFVSKVFAKAKKPSRIVEEVTEMKKVLDELDKIKEVEKTNSLVNDWFDRAYENYQADLVNHPAHYKAGGVETIDFIEAKDLNYRLGNVVKYVSRAGKKDSDPIQDLEKAAWYLQREIAARKSA
jgi:transposase-like protein